MKSFKRFLIDEGLEPTVALLLLLMLLFGLDWFRRRVTLFFGLDVGVEVRVGVVRGLECGRGAVELSPPSVNLFEVSIAGGLV